ncbi:hypothetical protein DYU05_04125 [Mucilaginibacter terrenus]|uniref:Oligosaccharide repeat unit polymerase n=1 Tax=Mucilaginibacter terrenus TaxID=2482727 RepID=A0A3E2NUV5_9SPHI|nr:hypothetical protein [Mucilaginibacter terrenus]RFZ84803.1 hypothetical protein DYU05_04125 [Mucilaginibacter terrenus]
MLLTVSIGFSLSIFSLGSYFIWFDKRNIFNHLSLGLCLVAYIIPAFVVDFTDYTSKDIIELYSLINLIGSITYLAGLFLGYKWKQLPVLNTILQFNFIAKLAKDEHKVSQISKLCSRIYLISLIGICTSFLLMGFVPIFAADPYMAKFFKGEYQAPYSRVAFLYRTCRQLLEFLMPLKVLDLYYSFNLKSLALVACGVILIAVSLNRTPIFSGILVAVSIIVALRKTNSAFWVFLFFVLCSYILGSSIYYILGLLYPDTIFGLAAHDVNFFQAIAYGAPDITDQLQFLNAFVTAGNKYTYGLTYVGGLIPFNFPWNPSVYTLLVLNDTNDITQIASGGLRLPPSVWGYVSFSWFGVIMLPFTSGFLLGYVVKKFKRIANLLQGNSLGYFTFFLIQFAFNNIAGFFVNFYLISIYSLPAIIIYYLFIKVGKKRVQKRAVDSTPMMP